MDSHLRRALFQSAHQYGSAHRGSGEVARIISRTYGEQSFKPSDKGKDLGDELADVLWVVLCLANQTGVDLTAALERNFDKKTNRDAFRHLNNEKLSK